ncbi:MULTISPECIES: CDP-alcohol phosphatidyltransferase family protein [Janibacter]|uniref:CDP-alcohol phosphatidyltransferase family protein n=1 Tax=Janibacter TaxID=53457 RepID=UPI001CD2BBF3|nr:CDP-alcohol phosphatidyltransferase family protein [Janibacter melonis]MCM3554630.1 CDP-alcohol phosphatidyltransferase family protein [Janibacter melonis]
MTTDPSPSAATRGSDVWTLPNALSAMRLVGVPIFLWAILTRHDGIALATLMLSGITDYLDGKIARHFDLTSRLGAVLDPVADRLYIFTTVLGLAYRDIIPWWLVAILVGRDLVLALAVIGVRDEAARGLPVHFVGKAATFNLLYAFPLLLLAVGDSTLAQLARPVGWAFAWWGVGLYLVSAAVYLLEVWTLASRRSRAA